MIKVKPFRGYRFNSDKIEDLGLVMAPPYEMISPEDKAELLEKNEFNIVKLSKPIFDENNENVKDCFVRAKADLDEWVRKGVLVKDEKDAFYIYEQVVTYKNTTYSNLGVMGLLALEDLNTGNILQCERCNEKRIEERSNLLKNSKSNFSMINCIYMEYEKDLMNKLKEISEKNSPDMAFKTHENIVGEDVEQRVWAIKDEDTIEFIQKILKKQTLYIADGQTRYEVGLEYKKMCEKNNPNHTGEEDYNYIMALFTNAFDDGLIQLPVHRLIKTKRGFSEDLLISFAQDYFKVEKIIVDIASEEFVETMKKQISTFLGDNRFSIYCGGNYFYRFTLKNNDILKEMLPDVSEAYRRLDVAVLNEVILKCLLNMSDEDIQTMVDYTTRATIGVEAVKEKIFDFMVVTNPVRAESICDVAKAHERMPEKSMFIFPKASTGVVVYKMEE